MRVAVHFLLAAFILCQSSVCANEMNELVDQLAARSYQKRDAAAEKLFNLGLAAEKVLEAGLKHEELEVRRRCEMLLNDIRNHEKFKKINAFLADKEGKKNIELPGWKRYRELAGSDKAARQFFVDMLLLDTTLFANLEGHPKEVQSVLEARTESLYKMLYPPGGFVGSRRAILKVKDVGLLLVLASHPGVSFPRQVSYKFTNFFYQTSIRNVLKDKKHPFRKLFLGWLAESEDEVIVAQMLQQAKYLNIEDELTDVAVRLAKNEKLPVRTRVHAFTIIGKQGKKEFIPLLEKHLNQKDQICSFSMGNNVSGQTQVGDVALGMLLVLTNQSHQDYNLAYTRSSNNSTYYKFNASFLGFSTEADRMAAKDRWKAWKEDNLTKPAKKK